MTQTHSTPRPSIEAVMRLGRAVFEYGVEFRRDEDTQLWSLANGSNQTYSDLSTAQTATRLQPVTLTERREFVGDRILLLTRRGTLFLGEISNPSLGATADTVFQQYHIGYLIGAVAYHCVRLSDIYADFVRSFAESCKTNPIQEASSQMNYSRRGTHEGSPYYEFDAFVSAARRTYDVSRYLLWHRFGGKGENSVPRSFRRTLPLCKGLPPGVLQRLSQSWESYGNAITEYRDCLHHYVPVDFALDSVSMERTTFGGWMARVRIPDNPEARSKLKFTYRRGLDALTFAHDCATELLDVTNLIMATARENRPEAGHA